MPHGAHAVPDVMFGGHRYVGVFVWRKSCGPNHAHPRAIAPIKGAIGLVVLLLLDQGGDGYSRAPYAAVAASSAG